MSLAVEQRPRTNEMGHISNVNTEPPVAIVLVRQRDRVIKVPRVDRVDGDDRVAGQVKASGEGRVMRGEGHVVRRVPGQFNTRHSPLATRHFLFKHLRL